MEEQDQPGLPPMKWVEMHERERDTLIGEKIFEHNVRHFEGDLWIFDNNPHISLFQAVLPRYTTEMGAAWLVVEHFRGRYDVHVGSAPLQYDVAIMDRRMGGGHFTASAASAPEAICLAALKAVGCEVIDE